MPNKDAVRPYVTDVPCTQPLGPRSSAIELVEKTDAQLDARAQALATKIVITEPPGLEISPARVAQYHADLLAEHGEKARPFVSSLQSERALPVDLGFPAAPTVAPTVLDSPTESWTTTLDASGNEAEDLFSMD